MGMSRAEKEQEVKNLNVRLTEAETVIVTQYSGLTVAEMNKFRQSEGVSVKVTKNSLVTRALKDTKFEGIVDLFKGPTAIATSQDPVSAAKAAYDFAKENDKLIIVGGAMGSQILDKSGIEALAKLPSLDELRAKIIGVLQAPATKLVRVAQAPAGDLARVISAYAAKGE